MERTLNWTLESHLGSKLFRVLVCVPVILAGGSMGINFVKLPINCLEFQAVINGLRWRLRKFSNSRQRVLHLVDSQVVACVIAKERTSSFRLRKGLQKLSTLLVASGCRLCVGYCHTSENPADIPSRWSGAKKPKNSEKQTDKGSTSGNP